MIPILWLVAALIIAGSIVFLSSVATRKRLPPIELGEGETLPRTALQIRAGLTLAGIALLTAIAGGCVVFAGPHVWWENDAVRLTFTGLLITALLIYLAFTIGVHSLEARDDGAFDERDSAIMSRSCAGVSGAMLVVLAMWMIGLTEAHIETRLIPSYFLYLIFWSCVMTHVIASLAGILLAYRRA